MYAHINILFLCVSSVLVEITLEDYRVKQNYKCGFHHYLVYVYCVLTIYHAKCAPNPLSRP
jgi:hypothetical protein